MSDYIVNVDETNAQQVLIDESSRRPVVVDFWAARSEPSQILSPLLENWRMNTRATSCWPKSTPRNKR